MTVKTALSKRAMYITRDKKYCRLSSDAPKMGKAPSQGKTVPTEALRK